MHDLKKHSKGRAGSAPAAGLSALCLALLGLHGGAAAQEAAAADAARKVDISEYLVRGNTVLDAATIEQAVTPFLGPGRTLKDVEGARDALLAAYQAKGYQSVYVDLPEQQVEQGLVLLQVSETKVGRVRVVGAQYHSPLDVRRQVPALREGQVPDFAQAQVELGALNRNPKRQVMPLVRQGALPGSMDVDLKVDDSSPWRASAGLNNDYSADTKKLRASASVGHDNLWQLGHSASLSFFGTPGDLNQTRVFSASYSAPVGKGGWSVEANAYVSNSNVASTGGTAVVGRGHALGLKANYTVPDTGSWWHSFSAGVDFKDNREALTLNGSGTKVPLKYVPFTLAYTAYRQAERGNYGFGLSLVTGTRASFGYASGWQEFDDKRYKASPSFLVLKGDANASYNFDNGVQLGGRAAWQMADAPLVSGEQMAAGGSNTVRGYLSAEATGDYGASAALEVRSKPLDYLGSWVENWRVYAFADGARLRLRDPMVEQHDLFMLASVGVGSHFQLARYLNGRIDFGYPLKQGPRTKRHERRINFSLTATY
ncbi:ShlB/FhaC/HecB family hemolysin secretion/activation protein [Janthinobacterium fluminis]|uniref:ShlB/FhaC/HecB family hemolysin secretion/activation protein n=1 Tax=Janthinobacterium fluminis TaxID=2987524 RepID=A0ABT5JZ15_9BURK|nr:ShlB/FhaC/HecB family hemolysin secretion/activation protein [Janthinobacterium fluminis]MDC8757972.1 ShlB/FhaC/HecB family hemolysin secretion/activation protein [Janthinobacterium fluminis]